MPRQGISAGARGRSRAAALSGAMPEMPWQGSRDAALPTRKSGPQRGLRREHVLTKHDGGALPLRALSLQRTSESRVRSVSIADCLELVSAVPSVEVATRTRHGRTSCRCERRWPGRFSPSSERLPSPDAILADCAPPSRVATPAPAQLYHFFGSLLDDGEVLFVVTFPIAQRTVDFGSGQLASGKSRRFNGRFGSPRQPSSPPSFFSSRLAVCLSILPIHCED